MTFEGKIKFTTFEEAFFSLSELLNNYEKITGIKKEVSIDEALIKYSKADMTSAIKEIVGEFFDDVEIVFPDKYWGIEKKELIIKVGSVLSHS